MEATSASPLLRSFERHLCAANRAPTTVSTYLHAVRQAHRFLHARGKTFEAATRADLEAFMADLLTRRTPATAATYLKVLKIIYAWLLEEGEVPADPTLRMRPPIVPDTPVPIVPDDGLKRLLQAAVTGVRGQRLRGPPRHRRSYGRGARAEPPLGDRHTARVTKRGEA